MPFSFWSVVSLLFFVASWKFQFLWFVQCWLSCMTVSLVQDYRRLACGWIDLVLPNGPDSYIFVSSSVFFLEWSVLNSYYYLSWKVYCANIELYDPSAWMFRYHEVFCVVTMFHLYNFEFKMADRITFFLSILSKRNCATMLQFHVNWLCLHFWVNAEALISPHVCCIEWHFLWTSFSVFHMLLPFWNICFRPSNVTFCIGIFNFGILRNTIEFVLIFLHVLRLFPRNFVFSSQNVEGSLSCTTRRSDAFDCWPACPIPYLVLYRPSVGTVTSPPLPPNG